MTQQLIGEDSIIANLEQAFSVNKMILFVGCDNVEDILTDRICQLPWSCIVTSSRNDVVRNKFAAQKIQIREYCVLSDLPTNIFEGSYLPIIKLYNSDMSSVEDEDDQEMRQEAMEDECNKILSHVFRKLDFTMQLIVIGYHPGAVDEVKRTTLMLRLKECSGAKISFFGLNYDDEETLKFKDMLTKQMIDYHESLLGEMLSRQEIETGNRVLMEKNDDELFFKNGKPVTVKQSTILRYKEVGTLLTEGLIHKIRPYGRIQQSRWFLNFLTRSSMEGPQWYGYLPQSEFYLRRNYESALLQLIIDILKGKENITKNYSIPVILEGDPTSSKSVVLAAIAYQVFVNREYPVVFIDNNRLNTREDIEALDEFMQVIEDIGGTDSKILLIWDGSSYRNVGLMARNIAKQLDNRGRRFLLVCSSYRNLDFQVEKTSSKYRYYNYKNGEIVTSSQDDMIIAQDNQNGCFFVHADGELSDNEINDLRTKVQLYAPDLKAALSSRWEALEKDGNRRLFDYLYKLIVVLQPPLEMGLDRERKKFIQYAQNLLSKDNEGEETRVINPMMDALIRAGLTIDEINTLDQSEDDFTEEDIHRMNICIALFSRFKLDCSVRLAIYILRSLKGGNVYEDMYSTKNRQLLNTITKCLPWIIYKPNKDNVFCFYYRSALEAEIFLNNSAVSPEDEINMVCEMIDFYGEDYKQNNSSDPALKDSLQRLIRMIGPNSEYFALNKSNNSDEQKGLMKNLDKIINKIEWLIEDVKIEDDDGSFVNLEITFLREYYGTNWNKDKILEVERSAQAGQECKLWDAYPDVFTEESYNLRLLKMNKAIDLANVSIDNLQSTDMTGWEKHSLASTVNALIVELSQCNIRLEELQEEYKDFCLCNNTERRLELKTIKPMSYNLLYSKLVKAIHSDPINGYTYNALFKLFEKEYEKSDNSRRYELLSSIRPIVDDAEAYDIEDRGAGERDELTGHIAKIRNYSNKVKVSIKTLDSGEVDAEFSRLFEDMLERGNASVLTFVCQQELDNAGLTRFRTRDIVTGESISNRLDKQQIAKCQEIREFMNREKYAACIENDANALYLKLKVTWMAYNGFPIMDGAVECRQTFLSRTEWIEVNRLCRLYDQCSGVSRRPIVVLLQALSIIQISGEYQEACKLLESLKEDMFVSTSRMRVPYLICDEDGTPLKFSGKVIQTDEQKHRGSIKIDNIPLKIGTTTGVRFYQKNIGRKAMPHSNDIISDLEMGIGYMGLSLYTETGRSRLEVR